MLAAAVALMLGVGEQVYSCAGGVCVGPPSGAKSNVQLGALVQMQRPWIVQDGGEVMFTPVDQTVPLALRGNQGGSSTTPDVIIGSINSRSGPGSRLASFCANQACTAGVTGDGDLIFNALDGGSALFSSDVQVNGVLRNSGVQPVANEAVFDAGTGLVQNDLQVLGVLRPIVVDAGTGLYTQDFQVQGQLLPGFIPLLDGGSGNFSGNVTVAGTSNLVIFDAGTGLVRQDFQVQGRVVAGFVPLLDAGSAVFAADVQANGVLRNNGTKVTVAQQTDAGTAAQWIEAGYVACSGSAATVTFNHTFSAGPICTLTTVADAGQWPVLEGNPSTTGFKIHCGGATNTQAYMCIGDR